ncbi:MAG: polymer-forming cytoskeletal protein [Ardenticatenales bacterium]
MIPLEPALLEPALLEPVLLEPHGPSRTRGPSAKRTRARALLAVAVVSFVLTAPGSVRAATFSDGAEAGYVLDADQTVDDNLFAVGQAVTIDGRVNGDLFAAGQDVVVNGTVTGNVFAGASRVVLSKGGVVNGDLFAGAREVRVAGRLDGDLRAGGSVVQVASGAVVGGEVMAGGYHVGVEKGGRVARGVYAGGNQVALDGEVGGDAHVGAGAVRLSGPIKGDVTLQIGADTGGGASTEFLSRMPFQSDVTMPDALPAGLTIEPSATIGGDLDVTAPTEPVIPDGRVGGDHTYHAAAVDAAASAPPAPTATDWLLRWLRRTLAVLVLGAAALWLAPGLVRAGAERVRSAPLPSLGWGSLLLVAAPICAIILSLAVVVVAIALRAVLLGPLVGPWLATAAIALVLLTAGVYVLTWLGTVSVALALGHVLLRRWRDGWRESLLLGAPLVALLALLPAVGWLVSALLVCLGVGALAVIGYRRTGRDGGGPTDVAPAAAASA